MIERISVDTDAATIVCVVDGPVAPHGLTVTLHRSDGTIIGTPCYALLRTCMAALESAVPAKIPSTFRPSRFAGPAEDRQRMGYVSRDAAYINHHMITQITITEKK